MPTNSFTQLDVWKKAHQLTLAVYRLTTRFPRHERFGLTSQMQRAAISVPANIAEGYGRRAPRDKAHFYNIAASSAEELRYHLILSRDLGYHAGDPEPLQMLDEVAGMLRRLWERTLTRV